jgi:pyruvate dehydrogenase E1 component alpha subunit
MLFRDYLLTHGLLTEAELLEIDCRVANAISEAVRWAEESPLPSAEELFTDVYVSY